MFCCLQTSPDFPLASGWSGYTVICELFGGLSLVSAPWKPLTKLAYLSKTVRKRSQHCPKEKTMSSQAGKKGENNRKETDETMDTSAEEHYDDQHAAVLEEQRTSRQEHKEATQETKTTPTTLKNWRTKKDLLCWRKEWVERTNRQTAPLISCMVTWSANCKVTSNHSCQCNKVHFNNCKCSKWHVSKFTVKTSVLWRILQLEICWPIV